MNKNIYQTSFLTSENRWIVAFGGNQSKQAVAAECQSKNTELALVRKHEISALRESNYVVADCGCQVHRGLMMNAIRGTSCPDCYDRMSE
jgi:hypothetical protein